MAASAVDGAILAASPPSPATAANRLQILNDLNFFRLSATFPHTAAD